MRAKHKVFAYITQADRLLVLSHPFAPEAGIQVPAGTVDEDEAWATAVLREATEETGLTGLQIGRYLGDDVWQWPGKDEAAVRHFYHLLCDDAVPDRWWHNETHPSEGEEAVIPFELFWVQMPHEVPVLAPGHGKFLSQLMADLGINLLPVGEPIVVTALSPGRREINGRTVSLLPLNADRDAPTLFAISHGSAEKEAIWTYMGYGPFADEAAMHQWLSQQAQTADPLFFTVVANESGKPVGLVSFLSIDPTHGRIEIGHIWYGTEFQQTKVNTEAVYLLLGEAFDQLHYRRVEWKCDALNGRSRRAALRLGFQVEGLFRQHRIVKGRNRDTSWYAMLDSDWPLIKENMESWLAEKSSHSLSWLNRLL
jgi:RimJ/RimL family protein N-acetyltransferase/8-oxo-dGTP pyrophosphatase MutT (NUDIX family)